MKLNKYGLTPVSTNKYTFDGVNDYIQIPNVILDANIRIIEVKIKLNILKNHNTILDSSNYDAGSNANEMWVTSSGQLNARFGGTSNVVVSSTENLKINTEYVIKLVFKGSNVFDMFINGVLQGTSSGSTSTTLSFNAIGGIFNSKMNGIIYDLKIYDNNEFLTRYYPINDGNNDTNQIKDIESGQHGTSYNFNENNWNIDLPDVNNGSVNGSANSVTLSPSNDNNSILKFNKTTTTSNNAGYILTIANSSTNVIIKSGQYQSVDAVATEINNSVIGKNVFLFIVSAGRCTSNNDLDNIMKGNLKSIHWKSTNAYLNSRENIHFAGVYHGIYGTLQEKLSVKYPEILYFTYNNINNILQSGYGKYVLVAPSVNNDNFSGTPISGYVIANCTAVLNSGTGGTVNIIFKQGNTTLATKVLTINSFIGMYQDVTEYFNVPANTNSISYTISNNISLIGLIVRWSSSGNSVNNNINTSNGSISGNEIIQNNLPISLYNKSEYDSFYKNNNPFINPSNNNPNTISLSNGNNLADVSNAISSTKTGYTNNYTYNILYYSCWVKGQTNIRLYSNNSTFNNPMDFTQTSNSITIAKSENTGKWELIEGFIFPEHYNQQQCIEYIKYFKENCFNTSVGNQSVIAQTPGTYYFGGKVNSNSQQISIGIETSGNANMYAPIIYQSSSLHIRDNGTLSLPNL